jgi:hypothetical protein
MQRRRGLYSQFDPAGCVKGEEAMLDSSLGLITSIPDRLQMLPGDPKPACSGRTTLPGMNSAPGSQGPPGPKWFAIVRETTYPANLCPIYCGGAAT